MAAVTADRPPPFPDSICHRCRWHRMVWSARSGFIMCTNPELAKYPPQPVRACPGFSDVE
jgi:hypothetical protein